MVDSDVTRLLDEMTRGRREAEEELLPVLYAELRKIAVSKMALEHPGHTLQPTMLVHDVYMRLLGGEQAQSFQSRRQFYAVAAECMRRILVDNARRRKSLKREMPRAPAGSSDALLAVVGAQDEVLAIHEALDAFAKEEPVIAELVKLHYFAEFTIEEAAELLGIPARSAYRDWKFAKAWLYRWLSK